MVVKLGQLKKKKRRKLMQQNFDLIVEYCELNGQKKTQNVLEELDISPEQLSKINRRKLKYSGKANINTKTNLMTTALQGNIETKRKLERPPITYMASIIENSRLCWSDEVHRI